jgi:hypothetical protein
VDTQRVVRALVVVGVLALSLTVRDARSGGSGISQAAVPASGSLQGSWLITVTPEPGPGVPPPFQALMTYTAEGGLIQTDVTTGAVGLKTTAGHGEWVQKDREYAYNFVKLLLDEYGQFVGTVRARETGTLNPTADSYSGSGKIELVADDGTVIGSYTGASQATRIRVEPLP